MVEAPALGTMQRDALEEQAVGHRRRPLAVAQPLYRGAEEPGSFGGTGRDHPLRAGSARATAPELLIPGERDLVLRRRLGRQTDLGVFPVAVVEGRTAGVGHVGPGVRIVGIRIG